MHFLIIALLIPAILVLLGLLCLDPLPLEVILFFVLAGINVIAFFDLHCFRGLGLQDCIDGPPTAHQSSFAETTKLTDQVVLFFR